MATQSVLEACGLQGALPPFTLIRQNSGVDGSFLIASILVHRVKSSPNNHVLLVATQHTEQHYSSACQKLGFNMAAAKTSGQLKIVDVMTDFYRDYADGVYCPDVRYIFGEVQEFLELDPQATILMDDLAYYLNFGCPYQDLLDRVENLVTGAGKTASFVVKLNTADLYETLCASLDDLAQTAIQLERLASGQFKEVDGRLNVRRYPMEEKGGEQTLIKVKKLEKSVLFKRKERTVAVFVPGEVGIKNL